MAAIAYSRYEVQLLDLASGTVLAALPNADQFGVLELQFSRDDRWLAVATVDRLIEVWDLPRVREGLRTLGLDW